MFNAADNENFSQVLSDGRRQRFNKGSYGGARNQDGQNNGPFYVTSPLNMSKQDVFSQTGKLNPQSEGANMVDDGNM